MMTRLLASLGLALILASPATAQDAPPPWLAACSNQAAATQLMCEVSQSIVLTEGNQRLASVAFRKAAGDETVGYLFTLPVGLLLPAGLGLSVDDNAIAALSFQSCDAQGCYASGEAPGAWIEAMSNGTQMALTIQRTDTEEVTLGFDLNGFGAVFGLLP